MKRARKNTFGIKFKISLMTLISVVVMMFTLNTMSTSFIRKSTSQSMGIAALQIAEMIGAVNDLSSEADKMLGFIKTETMTGFKGTSEVAEEYAQGMQSNSDSIEAIVATFKTIQANMNSINESAKAVETAVAENANGVMNTTEAVSSINKNMEYISSDMVEMASVVESLNKEISKFKI